jgi:hypothetical protein
MYSQIKSKEDLDVLKQFKVTGEDVVVVGEFGKQWQVDKFFEELSKAFDDTYTFHAYLSEEVEIPRVCVCTSFAAPDCLFVFESTNQMRVWDYVQKFSKPFSNVKQYGEEDMQLARKEGFHLVEFYSPGCGAVGSFISLSWISDIVCVPVVSCRNIR